MCQGSSALVLGNLINGKVEFPPRPELAVPATRPNWAQRRSLVERHSESHPLNPVLSDISQHERAVLGA